MPEQAVGLMAKYAEIGRVKSRLAADIGPSRALEIYRQLLQKAVALTCSLDGADYVRVAFVTPEGATRNFQKEYSDFDLVTAQEGNDLGERMLNALVTLLKIEGVGKAFLIGADIPELDTPTLKKAGRLLDHNDLVLGPTVDGGYYLIGMKTMYPKLFVDIDWGTRNVLQQTMAVIDKIGIRVGLLPKLRDLDDVDDLNHFVKLGVVE